MAAEKWIVAQIDKHSKSAHNRSQAATTNPNTKLKGVRKMETKNSASKAEAPVKLSDAIKPWRKEAPWWVQAIEALVALGLGIYVLTQAAQASRVLTTILAIFLLTDGLLSLIGGLRGQGKTFGSIRAGVGLLAGIALLLMPMFGFTDTVMMGWLLGLALIIGGVAGLLSRLFEAPRPVSWIGVLITLLMIALGSVYLYSILQPTAVPLTAVGWLLVAVGLALGAYAAFTWYSSRQAAA
jgi:uncharacterized membrane protein HdeD (DUF308 family)